MQANLDVLSWSLSDADMTGLSRLAEVAPQRMVDGSFWLNEQVRTQPYAWQTSHHAALPLIHTAD
jgi:diketogulonate reductase-like aldo/keto reductase